MRIYADNAATTKMSRVSIDAMLKCMEEEYGNPSSLYALGQQAKEVLEQARKDIAAVINAEPREILFTSGGSEADNQAIRSAAEIGKKNGKMHIISTAFEHHAILHTLKRMEAEGFEVTLLDVHEDGLVRVEELEEAIRDDTCLVTIMFANNEIGTVQPIREIGEVCKKHGVLFHTDAVQAVAHLPIDVKADNIDMLSSSAHKFHGPKGGNRKCSGCRGYGCSHKRDCREYAGKHRAHECYAGQADQRPAGNSAFRPEWRCKKAPTRQCELLL